MNNAIRKRLARTLRSAATAEDGQALVEFALVLPLLMLAIVMVLEFGKVFHYWQDETHLASQAARLAAVNSDPRAVLSQDGIAPELKDGGTDRVPEPAQLCIAFPDGPGVGKPVEVTVGLDYHWLPALGAKTLTSTVKGSATMRVERPPTNYSEGCSS